MTIICVKDGVIAADGSSWQGGIVVQRDARKIVRSADGAIGGSAGNTSETTIFCRRFASTSSVEERSATLSKDDPLVPTDKSGFAALWLEPTGEAWMMDYDGRPYPVSAEAQAIGGAWQLALGAMYAGASAEQAVRICIERSEYAAGEVFVARLTSVEAPPEDIDARPVETFGTDRVAEPVNERRAAMAEWKERAGLA